MRTSSEDTALDTLPALQEHVVRVVGELGLPLAATTRSTNCWVCWRPMAAWLNPGLL